MGRKPKSFDNNLKLAALIDRVDLTLDEILAAFNDGQPLTLSLRALKSYIAAPSVKSGAPCPDGVLERFERLSAGYLSSGDRQLVRMTGKLSKALRKADPDSQLPNEANRLLASLKKTLPKKMKGHHRK